MGVKVARLDPTAAEILSYFADVKRAPQEDIEKRFNSLDSESLGNALGYLMSCKFLDMKSDVLPQWNTYLITSDGLHAARQFHISA
ncbi:MAG: hypothetical protein AAF649_01840 [Verrucomicrobiota bacterium]